MDDVVADTVKGMPLLEAPATVTTTFPVFAPAGTVVLIVVLPQLVAVALAPLKVTLLEPWLAPKFDPVTVTADPIGPEFGLRPLIAGAEELTVKFIPLLLIPETVMTTLPLVAPLGTGATIAVLLQLVG